MEYVDEKDISVSYIPAPGDKLFYCPYNRAHQVRECKASTHLHTCREQYNQNPQKPKDLIVKCRWQPNKHHIRKSQQAEHEKNCDSNQQQVFAQFNLVGNAMVKKTETEPDEWD